VSSEMMVGAARPRPSRSALLAHCAAQKVAGFRQLTRPAPRTRWAFEASVSTKSGPGDS
jgi:hypothetical protein